MKVEIKTLNVYVDSKEANPELSRPFHTKYRLSADGTSEVKMQPKDGVYILSDSKKIIDSADWNTCIDSETAIGVVVTEHGHSVVVALKGSEEDIVLLEDCNELVTGHKSETREEAYRDFNGQENTLAFLSRKSPAAMFCNDYSCGSIKRGFWWLPSSGEMDLLYRNKTVLNKCLGICGGEPLPNLWHWTSSEYSCSGAWVLYWYDGRHERQQ